MVIWSNGALVPVTEYVYCLGPAGAGGGAGAGGAGAGAGAGGAGARGGAGAGGGAGGGRPGGGGGGRRRLAGRRRRRVRRRGDDDLVLHRRRRRGRGAGRRQLGRVGASEQQRHRDHEGNRRDDRGDSDNPRPAGSAGFRLVRSHLVVGVVVVEIKVRGYVRSAADVFGLRGRIGP